VEGALEKREKKRQYAGLTLFTFVRKHLENIFSKLGVETRTAAAAALRDTPAN
jgi:hypothetical protein